MLQRGHYQVHYGLDSHRLDKMIQLCLCPSQVRARVCASNFGRIQFVGGRMPYFVCDPHLIQTSFYLDRNRSVGPHKKNGQLRVKIAT